MDFVKKVGVDAFVDELDLAGAGFVRVEPMATGRPGEAVPDRLAARLEARPGIFDRSREIVEHPFGSIKQWMKQGAFLMRGLDEIHADFSLTALVYNLRRALNILGMEKMMEAVRA